MPVLFRIYFQCVEFKMTTSHRSALLIYSPGLENITSYTNYVLLFWTWPHFHLKRRVVSTMILLHNTLRVLLCSIGKKNQVVLEFVLSSAMHMIILFKVYTHAWQRYSSKAFTILLLPVLFEKKLSIKSFESLLFLLNNMKCL